MKEEHLACQVKLYITVSKIYIIVNRFRYINNNFTKDRCSIPLVIGRHKFSLHATIDHLAPFMNFGHYTTPINCCKNILLQRQQTCGFQMTDAQNPSTA